jgi:hypothetical protein
MYSGQLTGGAHAYPALGGNGEAADQAISILLEHGLQYPYTIGWDFVAKPKQHHTLMCLTATKNRRVEIFVVRYKDSYLAFSPGQDIPIIGLWHGLTYGQHLMASSAQIFNHRRTRGLINDEFHGGWHLC